MFSSLHMASTIYDILMLQRLEVSMSSAGVRHEAERSRFVLDTAGHEAAFLEYEVLEAGPTKVDMFETFVPPSLRGRGLARLLADAALDWALGGGVRVVLSCWYIRGHVDKHRQDVRGLVAG